LNVLIINNIKEYINDG